MFAVVGCYTTPDRDGRGDGIRVYRVGSAAINGPRSSTSEDWRILRCSRCGGTNRCYIRCMAAAIWSVRLQWSATPPSDIAQSNRLPGHQSG